MSLKTRIGKLEQTQAKENDLKNWSDEELNADITRLLRKAGYTENIEDPDLQEILASFKSSVGVISPFERERVRRGRMR